MNMQAYYDHESIIHKDMSSDNLDSVCSISVSKSGEVAISHSVDNSNIYTLLGALESLKATLIENYLEK
jgi:hypothetical protein